MSKRQSVVRLIVCITLLPFLAGCRQRKDPAHRVGETIRSAWYRRENTEIVTVQKALLPKIDQISDRPTDMVSTARSLQAYANAYADVDVTKCPADFRKQFYAARKALSNSAVDYQNELLYLAQHPDENPGEGGEMTPHLAQFDRAAADSMANAISQVQELRAIAVRYGVKWQ